MHSLKLGALCLWVISAGLIGALPGSGDAPGMAEARRQAPASPSGSSPDGRTWALYDPSPKHIWNRLYRSLYLRTAPDGREFGYDELDPLLWRQTEHLLGGPSHRQAADMLDAFLDTHAERLISDPLKRALLQRDLWAVFDWTTRNTDRPPSAERRALQLKLAQAIRRVALPAERIAALPNTYQDAVASRAYPARFDPDRPDLPFLPPDLFLPDGPWVELVASSGPMAPAAVAHVRNFSGRSSFRILIRLPGGRAATLAYLKMLETHPHAWIISRRPFDDVAPNPELPQFPAGTQLALVRQLILVDETATLKPTQIVESVQIRVHQGAPQGSALAAGGSAGFEPYEFRMSRERLLAGRSGGLRALGRDERVFPVFGDHGWDLFDTRVGPLEKHLKSTSTQSCMGCHSEPGIGSVLSRRLSSRLRVAWSPEDGASSSWLWKQRHYTWGLLQGLWQIRRESAGGGGAPPVN